MGSLFSSSAIRLRCAVGEKTISSLQIYIVYHCNVIKIAVSTSRVVYVKKSLNFTAFFLWVNVVTKHITTMQWPFITFIPIDFQILVAFNMLEVRVAAFFLGRPQICTAPFFYYIHQRWHHILNLITISILFFFHLTCMPFFLLHWILCGVTQEEEEKNRSIMCTR